MAKDRNVAAVDDFEAIMKPEVRLGKGMVGRTQASAMAMLKAGESLTVTEYMDACYPAWVRERGGKCQHRTMYLCPKCILWSE